jgi:hypothetical protein
MQRVFGAAAAACVIQSEAEPEPESARRVHRAAPTRHEVRRHAQPLLLQPRVLPQLGRVKHGLHALDAL